MPEKEASARQDSVRPEGSLPFFTRFLEGQQDAERRAATKKYPSDNDEIVTQKHPSDNDELTEVHLFGNARPTGGASDRKMTLKYPSDRDEQDFR